MSYPYQYSPQGQPGPPYPPQRQQQAPTNGYAANGYPVYHQASQLPQQRNMQYVNPQVVQSQPMVVIPQRSSQQHNQYQTQTRPSPQYLSQPLAATFDSIDVHPHNTHVPQRHPQTQHTPRPQHQTSYQAQQQQTPNVHQAQQRQQDGAQRQQQTPLRQHSVTQQHRQPLQHNQQPPRPQQQTPRPQQQTPRPQQKTPGSQQQATRPGQIRHPQVVITTPSRSVSVTSTTPRASPSPNGATDYNPLLLLLAEEYIEAAHGMGPTVSLTHQDQETYYKLMSTGMGCMEAVLKNYKLHPAVEGQIRLRFATLLHNETNNDTEADTILNHGIMLCQRHRLLDLKYSMQHLQARVLAKTNPGAAIKTLDKVIREAEDYGHVAWVYALRFLCVSLSQQTPSQRGYSTSLHHLDAISRLSDDHRDLAIYVVSATFKALLHLRTPGTDSMIEAQRAIADARQYQLDRSVQGLTQIMALLSILDVVCSIQNKKRDDILEKMNTMHQFMDRRNPTKGTEQTSDEGFLGVPIDHSSSGQLHASTGGIFRKTADGRDQLVFAWFHHRDIYCLGYYLSGVAASLNNEKKSMYFLQEGIKLIRGVYLPSSCQHLPVTDHILESLQQHEAHPESISEMSSLTNWRTLMDWHIRLQLAFHSCNRADWQAARNTQTFLQQTAGHSSLGDAMYRERLAVYLGGAIDQGAGQLDSALRSYQSDILALPEAALVNDPNTDIAILAALNTLLIIREPSHPQHVQFGYLMTQLEPFCSHHKSGDIVAAFQLIRGCIDNARTVNSTTYIKTALKNARGVSNQQLTCMAMAAFTFQFATDRLDEGAVKAHEACQKVAVRAQSKLWECTADGMLATLLEKLGNGQQAAVVRTEIEELRESLPEDLRGY
ncbi:hypothetical protein BU16DRAFT_530287 [Lophium mytilinum]|uniref:Cohesin loading factor-domain-containing protein n=1 Tax=Lophium mytilinum TaxID=390894 RepID=A0A6A6QII7_9PEZI|nr:hypothetical protein BU16DRAFT_530287 [Lophium mytilinum]